VFPAETGRDFHRTDANEVKEAANALLTFALGSRARRKPHRDNRIGRLLTSLYTEVN